MSEVAVNRLVTVFKNATYYCTLIGEIIVFHRGNDSELVSKNAISLGEFGITHIFHFTSHRFNKHLTLF
jgi:hypothetical protein